MACTYGFKTVTHCKFHRDLDLYLSSSYFNLIENIAKTMSNFSDEEMVAIWHGYYLIIAQETPVTVITRRKSGPKATG